MGNNDVERERGRASARERTGRSGSEFGRGFWLSALFEIRSVAE